ncbi:calcitonin receptor-like [Atheta coriaria]|uniref:calcitonin receptor-like n=1 Tax=Dalotia coriaria TaxID=877792 RepID=UPI0031F45AAC
MLDDQEKLENRRIAYEKCQNSTYIEGFCPPVVTQFEGLHHCWEATPGGTVVSAPCPKLPTFLEHKLMHKECWPNGTWFIHPNSSNFGHWTNYTECIAQDKLAFHMTINRWFVIGYSISLVALIISLIIFLSFRTLKCTRIRLHIHLFLSFIMNNIMWLIWYIEVIPRSSELRSENPLWCQAVEIFLKYFLVANYMWMFCEGLYLHISLVVVFVRDNVAWIWFVLIGWGIPFVVITIYAFVRIVYLQDTRFCWLLPSPAVLIYSIPVWITLAISFIFLCYVLRVIVNIMNPNSENPAPLRAKRAARATLILIPLFGLQYMLIPFRPDSEHKFAYLYDYLTVVITSLQGLCVSVLFCFANQDVHQAIARCLRRRLSIGGWSRYAAPGGDHSGGVFIINSSGNRTSIRMV